MNFTKVVLVGSVSVGKSAICDYAVNSIFSDGLLPTVFGQNFQLSVTCPNGRRVILQLWDTAGGEQYRSMVPMYFHSAGFCILVFDLTNETSLRELEEVWIPTARDSGPQSMQLIIVGNKSDLQDTRVVSNKTMNEYRDRVGAVFCCETSAKSGEGIADLFETLAGLIRPQGPERVDPPVGDRTCC
jgi:small GTP-binding protein